MKNFYRITFFLLLTLIFSISSEAQKKRKSATPVSTGSLLDSTSLSGLKFRSIGPAVTSGRIADFAVNPNNTKEFYVASAAGGVWKTINAGNTFTPVFDGEGSFSIGCVTLDPSNSNVVWVGTGENNNQRSVDFGDGIYKSIDGGNSWKNMGLKNSEHIGMIAIDPRNSDVIYVAAVGPLWSGGGDRGIYKSEDGGNTWKAILTVDENTGANEVYLDPRNPDILYATTHQRRRHVFTYISGGPGSAIYKSTDAGATWNKITKGLPKVDLGRIGMTISPADPDKIYAIVEAAEGKGGFYMTTNGGASWQKQNDFSTSGNYYQELFADPKDPNKVYAMNNWMRVTRDGGKTFDFVGEDFKHIDNHAMWIDPNDTDHILNGNDGGVSVTWDGGKHWDFMANLPVTQFYKVAVDNAEPFYYIYGGTQDNFSLGGPSRTVSGNGIANSEWFITNGGDGFESQVDPNNPNIVFAQSQYGGLVRYDKLSGEILGIQPKARKGENDYRWNWDAPLVVSKHKPGRLYFAANKVFKTDDYGHSWQVISDDLTAQIDRNTLPVMGRVWEMDAVAKNESTSPYGTIVAMDESPIDENFIVVGTDDGLIQITEDGGKTWRKVSNFPGVPANTYVNMVVPSQYNINTIYACFNDHKRGNFKPYVYKSTDKGNTWKSITANLPDRGSSFALAEDFVDSNLLFVGTEFGMFFSNNGGQSWNQMKAGLPSAVAIRDIAIQKRETDLVLASFGRGFFVLDDYSSLRSLSNNDLGKEAKLFSVRNALQFEYSYPLGLPKQSFQGDDYYLGENLGPEAIFTYYVKDKYESAKDKRKDLEKKQRKSGANSKYPTYDQLKAEQDEEAPRLEFEIETEQGALVRRLDKDWSQGVQRINWDLRYPAKDPVSFSKPPFYNPFGGGAAGAKVPQGTYVVKMYKVQDGNRTLLDTQSFKVIPLNNKVLPAKDLQELAAFQSKAQKLSGVVEGTADAIGEVKSQLKYIKVAIADLSNKQKLANDIDKIEKQIQEVELKLNGDRVAGRLDIDTPPSIRNRLGSVLYESINSTSGPTQTHVDSYNIALEEFTPVLDQVRTILNEMQSLNTELVKAGAPYTPGTLPELGDL
ncbi:MAG: glycosyl hydrolase [Cyclobacteriaceae bacterium]|nr:glycosyl hydrolase [Cyclobacteriaceae bacterium]